MHQRTVQSFGSNAQNAIPHFPAPAINGTLLLASLQATRRPDSHRLRLYPNFSFDITLNNRKNSKILRGRSLVVMMSALHCPMWSAEGRECKCSTCSRERTMSNYNSRSSPPVRVASHHFCLAGSREGRRLFVLSTHHIPVAPNVMLFVLAYIALSLLH